MKRILHEPLVHFLLLGSGLFALYIVLNPAPGSRPGEVVVTEGKINHLASTFARVWQRPPTAPELKGLIDQHVREEILSREAIKLGLDQDDIVIRRRLEQKMQFLAEDLLAAGEPGERDLADYLAAHPEKFRQESRLTFRQIFLDPRRRGDRLQADASALLARLRAGGGGEAAMAEADGSLLPDGLAGAPTSEVASQFGQEFAAAVAGLQPGVWHGPVLSGYGTHLVLVSQRIDGGLPPLDEVRDQVARELVNERRLAANRKFLDAMLARYRVTIRWPDADRLPEAPAASALAGPPGPPGSSEP